MTVVRGMFVGLRFLRFRLPGGWWFEASVWRERDRLNYDVVVDAQGVRR